jgi:hypothetical protein
MPYLKTPFKAAEHDPGPFLGLALGLPELEGRGEALKRALRQPLRSVEDMLAWSEAIGWFMCGYDEKLERKHWGVITARCLEAMFWRVQDGFQENPRIGAQFVVNGEIASEINIWCGGPGHTNLQRDMVIQGKCGDDWVGIDYPHLESEDPDLPGYMLGNLRVRAFWEPIGISMALQALEAWDAMRFGSRKFQVRPLAEFDGDAGAALGHTFGPATQVRLAHLAMEEAVQFAMAATPSNLRL